MKRGTEKPWRPGEKPAGTPKQENDGLIVRACFQVKVKGFNRG